MCGSRRRLDSKTEETVADCVVVGDSVERRGAGKLCSAVVGSERVEGIVNEGLKTSSDGSGGAPLDNGGDGGVDSGAFDGGAGGSPLDEGTAGVGGGSCGIGGAPLDEGNSGGGVSSNSFNGEECSGGGRALLEMGGGGGGHARMMVVKVVELVGIGKGRYRGSSCVEGIWRGEGGGIVGTPYFEKGGGGGGGGGGGVNDDAGELERETTFDNSPTTVTDE
ncbi:putative glycine-rich cell wall structural protein 1 [Arachis ipaensis]|uniref:putative glycine-rich cell wall structural protein 1 n=1 Tax=Arachis ipaensis TaxID=130454 RepID=UPI000A2B5856|nr:putative glycine-rich cell wall structural protein 1 [Arachis ipaensis]